MIGSLPAFGEPLLREEVIDSLGYLPTDDIAEHISSATGKWYPPQTDEEIKRYAGKVYEELYEIYRLRIKTKKETSEAARFKKKAGAQLYDAAVLIVTGKWRVTGYFPFRVHHPEREINAPYYIDRIVEQWLIEKYFIPVLKSRIYPYNMACQRNKGPDLTRKIVKEELQDMYEAYGYGFYIFQFDFKKYFDNIDHALAYKMFRGYRICDFALQMYLVILNSFHETTDDEECYAARDHGGKGRLFGVPKGNLPSQWTGIMYLNELDWLLYESRDTCQSNIRYMDDGICLCADRADARRCQNLVRDFVTRNDMGIMLHPKKTNIYPISRGMTFCGWRYTMNEYGQIRIREKNGKKWEQIKRLRAVWAGYKKGNISIEKAAQIRNGVVQYVGRGTDGESLTHKILREFELFDGEYETYFKGRKNPLGFRNVDWDDIAVPAF